MAEMLKQRHDIVVLKVELLAGSPRERESLRVRFTLQGKVDGQLTDLLRHEVTDPVAHLAGLFERGPQAGQEPALALPDHVVQDLRVTFMDSAESGRPLWVHLVKPYGVLRFVPWERDLGRLLDTAVLMLPDFIFPRPRESAETLEVALCASAPLHHEDGPVRDAVVVAARRILEGSPRATRVHVFTDAVIEGGVTAVLSDAIAAGHVIVHPASGAEPFVQEALGSRPVDAGARLRSPWLLWMREALKGQAIDVVHFCCHGYLSGGLGAMLFAQSPLERTDRYLAGPVGLQELQNFMTQVGAWSSAFESVQDNHSRPGLRALADEIAQARPGPMLMHDLRADPSGEAISQAYAFVYAADPGAFARSDALFLYCQPYLSAPPSIFKTADAPTGRQRGALPELSRNDAQTRQAFSASLAAPTDALFETGRVVKPWVAATERFADTIQLAYQALARDDVTPASVCEAHSAIANDTLDRIRAAVAELAQGQEGPA